MKKINFNQSIFLKLLFFFILVGTSNCDCGGKPGKNKNPGGKPNEKKGGETNDPQTIKAAISGKKEVVDQESIDFELKNEGKKAIDLSDLQAIITLSNQKDFDGNEIEEGNIEYQTDESNLNLDKGEKVSTLLGDVSLEAGETETIQVQLTDKNNLASATITFQLQDQHGNLLSEKVTNWKATTQIGPIPGKSKLELKTDKQKVGLEDGVLQFPFVLNNLNDHPINLGKVNLKLTITNTSTNKELYNANFSPKKGDILDKAGSNEHYTVTLPLDEKESAEIMNALIDTKLSYEIKALNDQEEIGKLEENLDFKVGPIAGDTKVDIELGDKIEQITKENEARRFIVLKIKLTNKNDYPISLSKLLYQYEIDAKGTKEPTKKGNLDANLFKSNILLPKETFVHTLVTHVFNTKQEAEQFLSKNKNKLEISFTMKSLDGSYNIGSDSKTY